MESTAWQNDNGNIHSTGNLLESPLTPHGKLWKTFYLFRNHFGYHIASSFPPTQLLLDKFLEIHLWSENEDQAYSYYSCWFISSEDGVERLLKYSQPSCHISISTIKSSIYIALNFQSTFQYRADGKRHHFHYEGKTDIKCISWIWIFNRIYSGKCFHVYALHHHSFPSYHLQSCLQRSLGWWCGLTPSVGRLH